MKRIFSVLFLLLIFVYSKGQDAQIYLNSKAKPFEVINSTKGGLTVKGTVQTLNVYIEKSPKGNFATIKAPGLIKTFDAGKPNLPVFSKLIEIPQGADVEVKVLSYQEQIINLSDYGINEKIYPAQPSLVKSIDPDAAPFYYDEETYSKDEFYNADNIASFEIRGTMRATRFGRLEIRPIQYNPVKNQLRILNDIQVEIKFVNADWEKTYKLKQKYSNIFFQDDKYFINSDQFKLPQKELIQNLPITFVIVAPDMFQDSLQRFIAWKKLEGYNVIEGYTSQIGSTTNDIKAFLEDLYNNPPAGVNPPSFVLFVGDVAQIPAWEGTTETHPTDLYYCDYTGDNIPDVYYGRWSAENSEEIHNILQKTLFYEKYRMDPSYLHEVFLVAGDDEQFEDTYGNGQINYGATYYFNSDHNIYSHTFLQDPPMGNDGVHDSIIADISAGVAFANYTAHCSEDGWASPSFSISDLSTLTNENKYSVWIGNCCLSNHFNYSSYDAFGEQALYIANKGAIGYIGGSNSTYWDEDYWWGVGVGDIVANPTYEQTGEGAYDAIFHDGANEVNDPSKWFIATSQIIKAGNLAVESSTSSRKLYYWEIYHLMGDPTLIPWIGTPQPLTLDFNPAVFYIGTSSIDVNAAPYTYIALTQDDELIGIALTDAMGSASISFTRPLSASPITVVARSQFHELVYQTYQPIAPDDAYLGIISYSPQTIDFASTTKISITVENFNDEIGSDNNIASLRTDDPYITIVDSTENLGNFAGGQVSNFENAFTIQTADYVPDGHIAVFNVNISNGTENWTTKIRLTINAPKLKANYEKVKDEKGLVFTSVPNIYANPGENYEYYITVKEIGGNGNNRLDAGDTAAIYLNISNIGHDTLTNTFAYLSSETPFIKIQDVVVLTGNILPQETKTPKFIIAVDDTVSAGSVAYFKMFWGSGNYIDTLSFALPIGLIVEDFETGDFNQFAWQSGGDATWVIDSLTPYEGSYCASSPDLDNSQASYLEISVNNVPANTELSFAYKVSSENTYDFLKFYVNGIQVEEWSGEVNWNVYTYNITEAGDYTFRWEYEKDASQSGGEDKAWIDFIVFPVKPNTSKAKNITITAIEKPDWLTLVDYGDGTAKLYGQAPNFYTIENVVLEVSNGIYSATEEFTIRVGATDIYTVSNHISFYPNPTTEILNIEMTNTVENVKYQIVDLNGKFVRTGIMNGTHTQINLGDLEKGVYMLNIYLDGQKLTNKIIIQ